MPAEKWGGSLGHSEGEAVKGFSAGTKRRLIYVPEVIPALSWYAGSPQAKETARLQTLVHPRIRGCQGRWSPVNEREKEN